jgi:catechol 2,3-dioxygenase-like lactoylglutathione lyase family enzyme
MCVSITLLAKEKPRPKILGITQVRILTTDPKNADKFYYGILLALAQDDPRGGPCNWCERTPSQSKGPIEFDAIRGPLPKSLIGSVALRTDDAEGLRKLLKKNKVKVGKLTKWPAGATFSVFDPENHKLIFVQSDANLKPDLLMPGAYNAGGRTWPHIIHAGFVVKDREVMDKFYRDILGFHVYWHGGMKDGETDWVDMQVPDGTDWIEYMLNVPENADQPTLGVMNHIALGVPNVKAAEEQLEKAHVQMRIEEEPQIGRDGKWQLNLYDPDQTRVELMDFAPTEKPCCAEYTGPHPTL